MIDFVKHRFWYFGLSLALIAVGAVFLILPPHLRVGIDFTSGTTFTVDFEGDPGSAALRNALASSGYSDAQIQGAGEGSYIVRTRDLGKTGIEPIQAEIAAKIGPQFRIPEVTSVGKTVAEDTVRNAIIAVVVAAGFVMAYIGWAFRSVPKAYRYAIAAVIAILHDVGFVLGLFAILGRLIGAEVNAIFVVGILTVIGFSVHDTIVVFDRIRENVRISPSRPFAQSVNLAIGETLMRSLGTSSTTLLVILAMLLIGGESLRDFLIVLFAGIAVGTYSSIFNAAQVLVAWENGDFTRWLPRRRKAATAS
ncbi:MAG: protein translocase subunit SecF [SAR202 cluster bacterium]|nr:protein translocase subunit SecF [SAR202 cluster bacterium]